MAATATRSGLSRSTDVKMLRRLILNLGLKKMLKLQRMTLVETEKLLYFDFVFGNRCFEYSFV